MNGSVKLLKNVGGNGSDAERNSAKVCTKGGGDSKELCVLGHTD